MAYATIDGFYNNDTLNGHINQYKTTNGGASAVQHEQTRGIQLYIKIPEKQVEVILILSGLYFMISSIDCHNSCTIILGLGGDTLA